VFGATWFLFTLEELQLGPAILGVVAGVGGFSSFIGAVVASRATRRFGIGRVAIAALLLSAAGNAFIPLAPAGLPLLAIACLVMQQLVADSAVTVYDITEVSVRQGVVEDRALGRVTSTFHVAAVLAQLTATLAAGALAEVIGLRLTSWIAPLGGVVGALILWASPVRRLVALPDRAEPRNAVEIDDAATRAATESLVAEPEQPIGGEPCRSSPAGTTVTGGLLRPVPGPD
jgi:MFS family permease